MRVVFRVDASTLIGTGHVMRCLTLADMLREEGASCTFVTRVHPGHRIDLMRERGYDCTELPFAAASPDASLREHGAWLGSDWPEDAQQTLAVLERTADWLVVDHYALDARWEQAVRRGCRRLLAIDDLADRPHACDMLLDQNLGRQPEHYAGLVPEACQLLVGPMFALVRPEFAAARQASLARRRKPELRQLLVTLGGVDKDNVTGTVLDALRRSPLPGNCHIRVVMGRHAPWLEPVRQQASTVPGCELLVDAREMATLMAESDLAVAAAGSTSWECCTLGLPMLVLVLAGNQRRVAQQLAAHRAAVLLGEGRPAAGGLPAKLRDMMEQPGSLCRMSEAAAEICDGNGALQVKARMQSAR